MRFPLPSTLSVLLLVSVVSAFPNLRAQDYVIEELISEETTARPPFSILGVERADQGLRLFLGTHYPDAVADLLASGALQAQLSDHQTETSTAVSLSLGKAVWCRVDDDPVYLSYMDPLPRCNGNPPARIEYFLEASVVLGPDRDLALGQDPDFLWLIEER